MKRYIASTVALAVAFVGQRFHALNWYNLDLEEGAFGSFNYTLQPIPVINYTNTLDLNEVGWSDEFIVYRRETPLELDVSWANSTVRARRQSELKKKSSIMCITHCSTYAYGADADFQDHPIQNVLADPGLYASFSTIGEDVQQRLLKESGIVMASDQKVVVEHAFVGNFKKTAITATLHAAITARSMSVQFTGSKTWMFISPEDYMGHFGGWPTNAGSYPTRMPAKDSSIGVFLYKSEPGDVVFFPPAMAHMVVTHPGPNVMVNFRRTKLWDIFKYPQVYGMTALSKISLSSWGDAYPKAVANLINNEAWKKISAAACPDGEPYATDTEIAERMLKGDSSPIIYV